MIVILGRVLIEDYDASSEREGDLKAGLNKMKDDDELSYTISI